MNKTNFNMKGFALRLALKQLGKANVTAYSGELRPNLRLHVSGVVS